MNDLLEIPGMEQVSKNESLRLRISTYLERVKSHLTDKSGTRHENAFYLNSSDSLENLLGLNLQGKKILTVSGSGEFAHAFIHAGAQKICTFDISPAAYFYTELRHRALCELEMSDYIKLFGSWTISEEELDNLEDRGGPIIDIGIYEHIAGFLSEETQAYFDLLFKEPELFYARFGWGNSFARSRSNKKNRFNRFVGDIIKDEIQYGELSEKARSVSFNSITQDVSEMEELVISENPDLIYISNIGYYPDATMLLAKKYLDLGVPEVICTVASTDHNFNDTSGEYGYDFSNFYYLGRKLGIGDVFQYELKNEWRESMGMVSVEVVGMDKNADYGLTLKIMS